MILAIDIETYSSNDLLKGGVYHYVYAEDFTILLLAYAYDDCPVQIVDLTCEKIPEGLLWDLLDDSVIKTAYNANFERVCLSKYLGLDFPAKAWRCTSVHALTLGMPNGLGKVAEVMKIDMQKDKNGTTLIKYFSCPCKPTKVNGERTRNLPHHDPVRWEQFKSYCKQDVEVERALRKKLEKFPVLPEEQRLWELDQHINDRGVKVDMKLVKAAMECSRINSEKLLDEAMKLTGLDNPNSVTQLKEWLLEAEGLEVDSLNKEAIPEIMKATDSEVVKRVMGIRQELAKTSVKKYEAIARSVGPDSRVRGLLQFYGANRSGRWAGRLVQIQNLPQNKIPDIGLARELLRKGDFDSLEMLFGNVPFVLSQLIRTAFIAKEGNTFNVADFSAIEARVLAWIAGERWVLDVFRGDGKIYEACASRMFNVPMERIKKGNPEYELRQKGKVATLACGYGGSVGALVAMGALTMGIPEESLPGIVAAWRQANAKIVAFWKKCERAAISAVKDCSRIVVPIEALGGYKGLEFICRSGMLFVTLPSGRNLAYVRPQIVQGKFGEALSYEGYESGRWSRVDTFGGKLVENIVQAIARDCLAASMMNLAEAGYEIVFHVHDEVICEGDEDIDRMCEIMGEEIAWAPELPLNAEGFVTKYYQKEG